MPWRVDTPRRLLPWLGVVMLCGALALGETLGWPWLRLPLEAAMSLALQRVVHIGADAEAADPAVPGEVGDLAAGASATAVAASVAASGPARLAWARPVRFGLRVVGALRLQAPVVEVAAPSWDNTARLLRAHDVALELRYGDLWRAWRGQPLRIERLHVDQFELHLVRLADGRASWRADRAPALATSSAEAPWGLDLPQIAHLNVSSGSFGLHDAVQGLDLRGQVSLVGAVSPLGSPWDATRRRPLGLAPPPHDVPGGAASASAEAAVRSIGGFLQDQPGPAPDSILQLSAQGRYHQLPLRLDLLFGGRLPGSSHGTGVARPVAVRLDATAGEATLAFDGQLGELPTLRQLSGRFRLAGPSLAAVGDTLGLPLPDTAAFSTDGVVLRQGRLWRISISDTRIGASRLAGSFTLEPGPDVPLLRGHVQGARLVLDDLGQAPGSAAWLVRPVAESDLAMGAAAPGALICPVPPDGAAHPAATRGRDTDLAVLRSLDADVAVHLAEVALDKHRHVPLRALQGRLVLRDGELLLRDIDARVGSGHLSGAVQLGRPGDPAQMTSRLRWDGVAPDHWSQPWRGAGAAPSQVWPDALPAGPGSGSAAGLNVPVGQFVLPALLGPAAVR